MKIRIQDFALSNDSKAFIIAELSANHNQNIEIAIETIKAAKRSGADAIKLQTFKPDSITLDCKKKDFIIKGSIWKGQNYFSLYSKAYTPWEWHQKLFKVAEQEGLICFSSPFDKKAVDFLEKLNVPAFKIASFEITDIPLIKYIASKNKPIFLSTGIADYSDIKLAIDTIRNKNNNKIILLKCTSSYPAPIEESNLCMLTEFKQKFNVLTGISDHTIGSTVPIISIAFGAKVIEKHFILDRSIGGPDSSFSMNEKEFSEMVSKVRDAEKAIGKIDFNLSEIQKKGRESARSLYVVKDVVKGDIISDDNVKSIRPGFGLHPKHLSEVIGKNFTKDVKIGTRFSFDMMS